MRTPEFLLRGNSGAAAVEYSLLSVAIAAGIIVTVFILGGAVRDSFLSFCQAMPNELVANRACGFGPDLPDAAANGGEHANGNAAPHQ